MEPAARPTLAARWKGLSSTNRRRIVLGSLFAVALAARDLMLFVAASSLFAVSELTASSRAHPAAS
ncbi:MAG TPA: hypothetical protein VM370_12150 [Candidatus Thermoplasmatota archaeon]|nr:hypothetical protein [Candidatus Thermoplasmatota archaeon]